MKTRVILLGVLLLLLSTTVFSIQRHLVYSGLNGRGWWGWACLTEMGRTGIYGNLDDFCGARDCPFEAAIILNCGTWTVVGGRDGNTVSDPWGVNVRITIPEDLKLVFSDGSLVGSQVCVGDKIKLFKGVSKGEFWDDGGNIDSPPVYWVDDVEKYAKKLMDIHNRKITSVDEVYHSNPVPDGSTNNLINVPVVTVNVPDGGGSAKITGALLCSVKNIADSYGPLGSGEFFTVAGKSSLNVDVGYSVECMYFYYGVGTGFLGLDEKFHKFEVPMVIQADLEKGHASMDPYHTFNVKYNSVEDFFKVGEIRLSKNITVTEPASAKVEITAEGADDMSAGKSSNLRILIKNSGDAKIAIKKVYATADYKVISCDSETVDPVGEADCVLSVTPQIGQGLKVFVNYAYSSCGKSQVGTASKVLFDSIVVSPKSSVQVYSIGVHSGCENSYYGCVPSDREGNFIAGYECYNQNDKFYSAGKERFDLMYELPDLSSKKILGASLTLSASKVNAPQTLSLYSVKSDWEPATCRAGGDICTQPYCGECKDLFELSGDRVAQTDAKSMGLLSFDVSEYVKAAYASGQKLLSFQVRGEENQWEDLGASSCDKLNDWSEKDVEIQGPGGSQPYLEIVYK